MGYPMPGMQLHVVAGRGTVAPNVAGVATTAITGNAAGNATAVAAGAQQYAQYARHQSAQRAYAYPAVIPTSSVAGSIANTGPADACKPTTASTSAVAGIRGVPEGAVATGRPNDSSLLSPTTGPAAATMGGSAMDAATTTSASSVASGSSATATATGGGPGAAVFYAMNV